MVKPGAANEDQTNRPPNSARIVPLVSSSTSSSSAVHQQPAVVSFNRHELGQILNIYGRMVSSGAWRDYAIDHMNDRAVFSVFRRASEIPLFRIEKNPKLTHKQGAYSVIAASGLIMKRGHELDRVLRVFDKSLKLVER